MASLLGVGAGRTRSHERCSSARRTFSSAAFPIGTEEALHAGTILIAIGCGVPGHRARVAVAAARPAIERPADAVFRESASGGEQRGRPAAHDRKARAHRRGADRPRRSRSCSPAPGATIVGGVALALASLCLIPAAFSRRSPRALPRIGEDLRSSALPVALAELRATTTRSVALAGIVAIAVYGGVAIGGARDDLLNGISRATEEYFSTAQIWVTSGRDVFNTNSFTPAGPVAALAGAPGVASVRVYRGGLLDIGERRAWVRARPAGDSITIEPSQLRHGNLAGATRLIEAGGAAAVSSDYADEHHLLLGSRTTLPTPSGPARLTVAAIATNSGWPAGAITISANDYARYWMSTDAAALEVSLKAGVSPARGRRSVLAALAAYPGLAVRTASEREALSNSSAHEGLRNACGDLDAARDRRGAGGRGGAQRDGVAASQAAGVAQDAGL